MGKRQRSGPGEGEGVSVPAFSFDTGELLEHFRRDKDYDAIFHFGQMTIGTRAKEIYMLAPAYPVALSRGLHSNFGFYCYREDGGFAFHNFHAGYAARYFIDYIIDGHEFKWIKKDEIAVENGFRIRGERDSLEKVFDVEPKGEERDWEPPAPYSHYYAVLLGKKFSIDSVEQPSRPDRKPRKPKTEEEKVATRKMKAQTGDYITIGQICEKLGHHPRVCRAILRKLKTPKPAHGWAWPPSETTAIEKRIRKELASG